jgi:aconitate hydratase
MEPLGELGFNLVGYGCTTCIGNSGPLEEEISQAITRFDLSVCSVLSGNRNFEGRIHPEVKMNYLASPPLVVAYALAGRMDVNLLEEPLATDMFGKQVYLRDIWPSQRDVNQAIEEAVDSGQFSRSYGEVFEGDENWNGLEVSAGDRYAWNPDSTYVKRPPYFDGMHAEPAAESGGSPARGRSRCSATASRPTTSPRRGRSRPTRQPAGTCASAASSAATSTPTAHGAATTRS